MKVLTFFVDGFEEIEALYPVDLLRRANIDVTIVTPNNNKKVKGSHNIEIIVDKTLEEIEEEYDVYILPGGPGVKNYYLYPKIEEILNKAKKDNKLIAAICAAPSYLDRLGLIRGKKATVHPSEKIIDAIYIDDYVVIDENLITARSIAASKLFGLEIIKYLKGNEEYENIKKSIIF